MDKEIARELLSAYRPNGSDALDDGLREALAFAERDPETRDWFARQTRFDQSAAVGMGEIPVPAEGKTHLLEKLSWENDTPQPRTRTLSRFWAVGAGIAAILVFTFALIRLPQPEEKQNLASLLQNGSFSLPNLANEAMPLDFRSNQFEEVRNWLATNQVNPPDALPEGFSDKTVLGCRRFPFDGNGAVNLLCFESDGEQIHLFVFEGEARSLIDGVPENWIREDGWNLRKLPDSDSHSFAVATKADPGFLGSPT